jgi:hypothetical protein
LDQVQNLPGLYVVRVGRQEGIFHTWERTEKSVTGFKRNEHKKFAEYAHNEAKAWLKSDHDWKMFRTHQKTMTCLTTHFERIPKVIFNMIGEYVYPDQGAKPDPPYDPEVWRRTNKRRNMQMGQAKRRTNEDYSGRTVTTRVI